MRIFYATNRDYLGDGNDAVFGSGFQVHPDFFRVGWCDCGKASGDPLTDPAITGTVHVAEESYDYNEDTGRYAFTKRGSPEVFGKIREALQARNTHLLVFIPGFNYSFTDSLRRAALLAQAYSRPDYKLVPFVFSWPSDGVLSPAKYISDRRDAELSGGAIARAYAAFLERIRELREEMLRERLECTARLHLVAHSMGAYALRHAVQIIARPDFPASLIRMFDTTVIAAGDEDRDTFTNPAKLAPLRRLTSRLDVYFNENDKPVRIGDDFDGETDRIGAYGPPDLSFMDSFGIPVRLIDCRYVDVPFTDGTRHQYYRASRTVIEDIQDVLRGVPDEEFRHRKLAGFDEQRRCYVLRYPPDERKRRPAARSGNPPHEGGH